jgi:hypothetical protein
VAVGELGAQTVDVVVGPVDREHDRPVDQRPDHLPHLEADRDEHDGRQARLGRVSGDRVGEVARRRAGHGVEAELPRLAHGHADHPVLEGPGRVAHSIVLQIELAESPGLAEVPRAHQRRHPHVPTDHGVSVEGQEVSVPPDAGRTRRDALPRQDRADRGVVVVDLEGAEAGLADVDRALRDTVAALPTDEPSDVRHEPGPPGI